MLKFCIKVFNSIYFPDHRMALVYVFCMMIDIGPKLYSAIPPPIYPGQAHILITLMFKFYIKVSNTSYIPDY